MKWINVKERLPLDDNYYLVYGFVEKENENGYETNPSVAWCLYWNKKFIVDQYYQYPEMKAYYWLDIEDLPRIKTTGS